MYFILGAKEREQALFVFVIITYLTQLEDLAEANNRLCDIYSAQKSESKHSAFSCDIYTCHYDLAKRANSWLRGYLKTDDDDDNLSSFQHRLIVGSCE